MDEYDIYQMLKYYYDQLNYQGIHIKTIKKIPKYKQDITFLSLAKKVHDSTAPPAAAVARNDGRTLQTSLR